MNDFFRTVLFFLLSIGPLVIFHELGHFWVARLCGVKVLRFSFGLGKPIWTYSSPKTGTEWSISRIPLGGYVKMLDAREADISQLSAQELDGEFTSKSVWKRMAIVVAGPMANFILAILVFTVLLMSGVSEPTSKIRVANHETAAYQAGIRQGDMVVAVDGQPIQTYAELRWAVLKAGMEAQSLRLRLERPDPVVAGYSASSVSHLDVTLPLNSLKKEDLESNFMAKLGLEVFLPRARLLEVIANGPAAIAGLQVEDVITAVGSKPIRDAQDLIDTISLKPNAEISVTYERKGQLAAAVVRPIETNINGKTVGQIQVSPDGTLQTVKVYRGFFESLQLANQRTWEYSALTLKMLGKILIGEASIKNITGPITIATYANKAAKQGLEVFLAFVAVISISLGVMNLLPIPLLDGGHLLYYSLEVLSGKAIPAKYLEMAQRGGFAVLMCLMAIAIVNDVLRKMP